METTARTRPSWWWWVRRHRGLALSAAAGVLILVVITTVLLLRSSRGRPETRMLALRSKAALRQGDYESLRRADRILLRWLRTTPRSQSARSLRLLVATLLVVEHGDPAERAQDLARQAGHPEDAAGQAGLVLAALTEAKVRDALDRARKAARRHPASAWLAYARATARTWQGRADLALTRLAGVTASDARRFLVRAQVRALLAQRQFDQALGLLDALPTEVQSRPWATVLRARCHLARSPRPAPRGSLDALVGLVALPAERVGPLQRRWSHLLLAEMYERIGKPEMRARHASAALRISVGTEPPALAEAMAAHLLRHRQPARALQVAMRVYKTYPERSEAAAVAARAALALSNPKQALALLRSLPADRQTVATSLLRVQTLDTLGRAREAEDALKALRQRHPDDPHVRLAWAKRLLARGRPQVALQEVESVLRQRPRLVAAIVLAAHIERSLGKATDAAMRFEAAVRLNPKDPSLRAALVDALIASGDLRSAANALDAAEAAFPDTFALKAARGHLLLAQGETEKAIAQFRAARKQQRHDRDTLLGLVEALLRARRVDEAASLLESVGTAKSREVDRLRGWLARLRWDPAKGDPRTALRALARAARGEGRAARHAAMLLLETEALRRGRRAAERRYLTLARRFGHRPELAIGLALARLEDDANQAALKLLRRAAAARTFAQLHPADRAALYARRAQAHWQAGNFSAARRAARAALDIDRRCARAQAVLGIVAYERRQFRAARKALEAAVALDPRLPLARYYLGMTLLQYGQRRAARRHLRTYLVLRPKGPLAPDARMALRR